MSTHAQALKLLHMAGNEDYNWPSPISITGSTLFADLWLHVPFIRVISSKVRAVRSDWNHTHVGTTAENA